MRRTKQQKLLYYTRPSFYHRVLLQLEDVEEKVCWLLAKYEKTRNSDMFLLMKFWNEAEQWNGMFIEPYIYRITSAETITRIRRYLQNTLHLWMPTDEEVIEARSIKELAIKDWAIAKARMEK
ncbi:hypothetical protein LCGC14_1489370 [marine sediment metagenome]|uniref:Uncharacterized protein n=1 Tax=marine sediment metagenome TaxID=412755 RepID=A0A0F9LMM7_9ZZZZ